MGAGRTSMTPHMTPGDHVKIASILIGLVMLSQAIHAALNADWWTATGLVGLLAAAVFMYRDVWSKAWPTSRKADPARSPEREA